MLIMSYVQNKKSTEAPASVHLHLEENASISNKIHQNKATLLKSLIAKERDLFRGD